MIVNEHHPFTFKTSEPSLFFIEGVSAVGEVKTVLTSAELIRTFEAARQFKKLCLKLPAGALTYASPSHLCRYYQRPPFFLFAFESQLSLDALGKCITTHTEEAYAPGESIDGIFVLDRGFFIDLGKGDESFIIRDVETKVPFTGWWGQPSDRILYDMLAWLSIVMPSFTGGVPILAVPAWQWIENDREELRLSGR